MGKKRNRGSYAHGPRVEVGLWFHPNRGARIQIEPPAQVRSDQGFPVVPWRRIATVAAKRNAWGRFTIVRGQSLPNGYMWANPTAQHRASEPHLVYAAFELRCSDCKTTFVWRAREQQRFYETIGVYGTVTIHRCPMCAAKQRARKDALEAARVRYTAAVKALEADATGEAYAAVAKHMLAILDLGGQLSIEKAIGHCTRARKLGASNQVSATEAQLRAKVKPKPK